jgi:DNA polymerase-1
MRSSHGYEETEEYEESTPPSAYRLIRDADGVEALLAALAGEDEPVALDLETTGLDPRTDRVRLLSLAIPTIDGEPFAYMLDCFALDPAPVLQALADKDLVIHNGAFDLAFLGRLGFTPSGRVRDTMLQAQLLAAGTRDRVTLASCCERYLDRALDKAEQRSDWSANLTAEQLAYAAADAAVLVPLCRVLATNIREAGLERVAEIEERCLPALVWMGTAGVPFNRGTWEALAQQATADADRLRADLDAAAPGRPDTLVGIDAWNWDSPQQVGNVLGLVGCPVEDTADETLARLDHPLATLLRQYRDARKRCTTYGAAWLDHVAPSGRVYATWRQLGAASGRMSCSDPNMQQLPRGEYRRCVAAPAGRVLVKADYSQIELRIAAKLTGDRALSEAYGRGEDLHERSARTVLRVATVTPDHRQLAKALNFGLLYGMGAPRFREYARTQYGVELSLDDARRYRRAFLDAYPGLESWHRQVGRSGDGPVDTRTLTGRRRLGVGRFTEKLNAPVQGTGADGLKLALALLWERRGQCPGAVPVLAVHDEIVVECNSDQAAAACDWLRQAMLDGMAPLIEPVPCAVEVKVGRTWAGD